jgi:hypothetical protein
VLEENIREEVTGGWSTLQKVECPDRIQEDDIYRTCTTLRRKEKLGLNVIPKNIKEINLYVDVTIMLMQVAPLLKYQAMKANVGVEV